VQLALIQVWRDVYRWKPSAVIVLVAAAAALTQANEYMAWMGLRLCAGLETIPVHFALVNQHACPATNSVSASFHPFAHQRARKESVRDGTVPPEIKCVVIA
jgi:hypothetical protein